MSNMELKTEYTFVDLYKNKGFVETESFMISGDKYIETYRCGDPPIRTCDDFVCKLWGFQESNNVRTLVFINEENERMLHVNINMDNMDGKVFTSGFVNGNFLNIDMSNQFNTFQQY